jgi:hypothetical protein
MSICEDFGSIAERLHQIQQEKSGSLNAQNPAPVDAAASSESQPENFDDWFHSLVWSTCC